MKHLLLSFLTVVFAAGCTAGGDSAPAIPGPPTAGQPKSDGPGETPQTNEKPAPSGDEVPAGSAEGGVAGGANDPGGAASRIGAPADCGGKTCAWAKQYCLVTADTNGQTQNAQCVDRPIDCGDCGCLLRDAFQQIPHSAQANAMLECPIPQKGRFTVTCYLP